MDKLYDIFISFKNLDERGLPTRDSIIAKELYDFFSSRGMNVFSSNITLENLGIAAYKKAIDDALDSAKVLVAVGTSPGNLNSRWVRYEWDSFLNDILSGVKNEGRLFCYVEDMAPSTLPRGLRQFQIFIHEQEAMQQLYNFITHSTAVTSVFPKEQRGESEERSSNATEPQEYPTKLSKIDEPEIIEYRKLQLEQKTKLERLSLGLSINNNSQDINVIDTNHKYEKVRRIDVLDTMNGKYTSHRWLTLRNSSNKRTLSIRHKESGDNKIRFESMNFKAYVNTRNGQRLHVKKLIELQPSYVQIVEIYFPTPLNVNDVINIYFRLSWPGEPISYSGDEYSQSISLTRYLKGVSHLEFGLLEIGKISSIRCTKISNLYEEILVDESPIVFLAEDDEAFKPIHGKGYKGFYFIFDSPDGIAYRTFYHLDKLYKEEKTNEF